MNAIVSIILAVLFILALIALVFLYLYSDIFVEASLTDKRHKDYESRLSIDKTTASISTDIRSTNI